MNKLFAFMMNRCCTFLPLSQSDGGPEASGSPGRPAAAPQRGGRARAPPRSARSERVEAKEGARAQMGLKTFIVIFTLDYHPYLTLTLELQPQLASVI